MLKDPTVEFVKAVVENMQGAEEDWQTLAMVISINQGLLSGTYGYAYNNEGAFYAVASRPSRLVESFTAYMNSHFTSNEPLPVKLLIEFNRQSKAYRITFEDTDTTRWHVSPDNIDTIIGELRPQFT